jgi:hypothetical protein
MNYHLLLYDEFEYKQQRWRPEVDDDDGNEKNKNKTSNNDVVLIVVNQVIDWLIDCQVGRLID